MSGLNKAWSNKTLDLRNPYSTRPWQHVLEPLEHIALASKLSAILHYMVTFNFDHLHVKL